MSLESRVRIPESVLFQELDGEAVLLHLESGVYFGLDPIGTRMWHLLEESESLQATDADQNFKPLIWSARKAVEDSSAYSSPGCSSSGISKIFAQFSG